MSETPLVRRQRRVATRDLPGLPSSGAGEVAGALAEVFGGLSRQIGEMKDRAAVDQGTREGAEAGFDPEFRPREDGTLYGQAYDAAGLRTAMSRLDTDMRRRLDEAYVRQGHDPAAFSEARDKIRADLIETLPPAMRPAVENDFARLALGYDRDIARQQAQALREADLAAITGQTEERLRSLQRQSYALGLDPQADAVLAEETESFRQLLLSYGPKEGFEFGGEVFPPDDARAGALTAMQIEAQLSQLGGVVAEGRFKGAFSRLSRLGDQERFLDEFRQSWVDGGGVAGALDMASFERLGRFMEAGINDRKAELRAQRAEVRENVAAIRARLRDYRAVTSSGLTPAPEEIASLRAAAAIYGDADLAAEAEALAETSDLARLAVRQSPVALQGLVNAERTRLQEGATPEDVARLEVLEDALSGMNAGLSSDPLSYANAAGVASIEPLDFSGSDGGASFAARRDAVRKVRATYGVKGAFFTDEEAGAFGDIVGSDPAATTDLAARLVRGFGDAAPDALAEISDHAPQLAEVGGLMLNGSSMATIRDIARGMTVRGEAGFADPLTPAEKTKYGGEVFGTAFLGNEERLIRVQNMAANIHAARIGPAGSVDKDTYKKALAEAAGAVFRDGVQYGGPAPIRGERVIVPNWIRANRAEEIFTRMTSWQYGELGEPVDRYGAEISARDLRRYHPVRLSDGVFALSRNRPGSGEPLELVADASGQHEDGIYRMDLNKIRGSISRLHPLWAEAENGGENE